MADTGKKAVVLYDHVGWYTGSGDEREAHEAFKHDEISLPADEFDRLSNADAHPPYGAVAAPGSKAAKAAFKLDDDAGVETNDEL